MVTFTCQIRPLTSPCVSCAENRRNVKTFNKKSLQSEMSHVQKIFREILTLLYFQLAHRNLYAYSQWRYITAILSVRIWVSLFISRPFKKLKRSSNLENSCYVICFGTFELLSAIKESQEKRNNKTQISTPSFAYVGNFVAHFKERCSHGTL